MSYGINQQLWNYDELTAEQARRDREDEMSGEYRGTVPITVKCDTGDRANWTKAETIWFPYGYGLVKLTDPIDLGYAVKFQSPAGTIQIFADTAKLYPGQHF